MAGPVRALQSLGYARADRRAAPGSGAYTRRAKCRARVGEVSAASAQPRMSLRLAELDRVFGGGLLPGSVTLLGGEPGIGKSTLLLQVAATLSQDLPIVYASGEESMPQVALRAQRLGLKGAQLRADRAIVRSTPSCRLPPTGAARAGDRFDPVDAARDGRFECRLAGAAARMYRCARAVRERRQRRRGHHRRPRHQGWRHRRTAAARAPGRHGAVFRRATRAAATGMLRATKNRFGR